MNWLLGLIGAVVGAGLGEDGNVLGLVLGFLVMYLVGSLGKLRTQVEQLRREIANRDLMADTLRTARQAAQAMRPDAPAAAASPPIASAPFTTAAPASVASPVGPTRTETPVPSTSPVLPPTPAAPAMADPVARPRDPMPPPTRIPPRPTEPDWGERLVSRLKSWFTEGNVPVKIGVLVLLFGVAAALRFAVAQGYFHMPIEFRLAAIAAAAIVGLAFGWRERARRPAFGLSLQGGAIGVLLLTVFAAYRMYALLPSMLAFVLVVVLVAGSAFLSVLQKNMSLAVLGFLGGYLAPVLISTGSANHFALFSYYAVLNAAVFAISWRQSWRLLNLIGFAFTFGVGTAWGKEHYRPELFWSVEPFLVLFFLFYISIGLSYVLRQTEYRRPWVDGTLVFGTPLVAFPLQAAMLKDDRMGLAFSALAVAGVYAALVWWLRQRRGERLLTEAYGALALGFATLAVPLAFSASTTASVWALEGAGVAWLGIRQNRRFPWLSGLALQGLAAVAYINSVSNVFAAPARADDFLLLNANWLGAAMLAFAGFALSLIHDRHRPKFGLPALLFVWATLWWIVGCLGEWPRARESIGDWQFTMYYLAGSAVIAALLRNKLAWSRLNWLIGLIGLLGVPLALGANAEFGSALAMPSWPSWTAWSLALLLALRTASAERSSSLGLAHLGWLWTLVLAATMQAKHSTDAAGLAQGWQFAALVAPLAVLTFGLWQRPALLSWPRAARFAEYGIGWFGVAVPLLALAWVTGLFLEGGASPLVNLPLLNPLDLALLAIGLLCLELFDDSTALRGLRGAWPIFAFAFITMATLRGVHHLHGEPWSAALLESGFSQASLTIVWSLIGVSAWIIGSRRLDRRIWTGGLLLMIIVLAKLLMVDRSYMGNLPGIVSFIAVGLLLVGVGYIAPSPPKSPIIGET